MSSPGEPVITDYNCGCVPELDHFCGEAKPFVEQVEEVNCELAFAVGFPEASVDVQDLEEKELAARQWLARHYREQPHKHVVLQDAPDEEGAD